MLRSAPPGRPSLASGSKSPAFTSPALAITTAGASPRALSSRSRAARSSRPGPSACSFRTASRPSPSIASALVSLGCTYPEPNTGIRGRPPRPSTSTSTPCRRPHHRRAHASAVKFAMVAPVVRTPPHDRGRPKSSFNQPRATDSRCPPSGVATHAPGFWSHVDVSQSAPSAAGVVPPLTKWKNFGPAECTSPPPPSISSCSAAIAPIPSSGREPSNDAAASSACASRTGRSPTVSKYFRASSATNATTGSSSSTRGGVGDID